MKRDVRLLKIAEVAERLRVCTKSVRAYLRRGLLAYVQLPGTKKKLVPEDELERALERWQHTDQDRDRAAEEVVRRLLR